MKKFHHHFIHHLRSYRTFHFMFFTFFLCIVSLLVHIFSSTLYASDDLLEQAFDPAFKNETIINLGEGKNAVGNEVLKGSVTVGPGLSVGLEAPLIVRIAKFLLRITMVLSVTMVIFNGIMWIIESSKGSEVKDAKKNIILIVVGILLSLMSLGIINLISSLTVSSLG